MRGPCDPEMVFELADGTLPPEQRGEVRAHLGACPECRDLYEREVNLNAYLECLQSADSPDNGSRSVCQGVAMALPTRTMRARLLWGTLAVALLLAALLALNLNGENPITFFTSVVDMIWSLVSGVSRLIVTVFAVAGPFILIALALGAIADVVIAAVVFSAARHSSKEA